MRRPPHANDAPHRVVIVGGGFGGLYAAKALKRAPVEITLIDRANHHLFQPLLYQVATGILTEGEIAPPLRGVLRRQRNARVLLAEVTGFDLDARTVIADDSLEIPYDSLIVAAGATVDHRGPDDGSELAPGLKSLEDARAVRSRILRAFELAELADDPRERDAWLRFAIVGGGPTGVEIAGQIADLARRTLRPDYRAIDTATASVALLEVGPELLPEFPEPLRKRAVRDLERLGVDVHVGTAAATLDADGLDLADGGRLEARTVLWAAGVAPSPLARALAEAAGARVDGAGRIVVCHDLTLPKHANVFAVGDMAAVPGVPGVAPAAMQQGWHAARVIRARLASRHSPGAFRYLDKGQLAVVGHNRAVGTAFGLRVTGRLALLLWAVVHVRYLLGWGDRLVTVVRWLWTMAARNRGQRVIASHGSLKAPAYNPAVNI
ncbi:MAG TPA: NAD(P)/FAD-dependent oxidoreductase [Solirubrobacteraceae bacterium]|nr:NAD(P)/FAD-dependent oxidoreductase [Solirubrobacteraceae bacterium]